MSFWNDRAFAAVWAKAAHRDAFRLGQKVFDSGGPKDGLSING